MFKKRRKLKTLAGSLKKSYIALITIFFSLFIFIIFLLGKYTINNRKQEMRNAMQFLRYEMGSDDRETTMKIFTGNQVNEDYKNENPILLELEVVVRYKNYIYSECEDNNILKIAKENLVKNTHYYDYLVLENNITNKDGDIYNIVLVKNMKVEKAFYFKLVKIYLIGTIITIIISVLIMRYFLEKVNSQFEYLEKLNTCITLENLKILKPEPEFLEFEKILLSYKDMLERLDEQNKLQIDFVHNSSHELKTPIFIIGGYIDMIERWGKEDKNILNESIELIKDEVKGMSQLVEKLLFIAKDKNLTIDKREFEISELILEVISQLKLQYPNQNIKFEPEYVLLNSDSGLIKLLIRNLIENAIKYGNNRKIEVSLKKKCKGVILEIKDNGIGMKPEELEHIYDRFYRANKSRSRLIQGHGLGMTIVKRILDTIEGKICIKSVFQKGTTIIIYFKE